MLVIFKLSNQLTGSVFVGSHVKVHGPMKGEGKSKEAITNDFLTMFAEIVKPHWNLLAPYIVLNNDVLTEEDTLQQLQMWKEKEVPTYGDLYKILNHLIIDPVVSQEDGRSKGSLICTFCTYKVCFNMCIKMSYCRGRYS